jgi:hypothetical protein
MSGSEFFLIVQGLVVVVVIATIYYLWGAVRTFGGMIGRALDWMGAGIIIFAVEAMDKILASFGISLLQVFRFTSAQQAVVHDVIKLLALFFIAVGLAKFVQSSRA